MALGKKHLSLSCVLRSCSIRSPSAAVIAADQAEVQSTEEALNLENDLWRYQNEKEKSKKIAGRQEKKKG